MRQQEETIALVENLDIVVFVYILLKTRKFTRIYYVTRSRFITLLFNLFHLEKSGITNNLRRIDYPDLPGSYFDTFEEGTHWVNDAILSKYHNNLYLELVSIFCKSSLFKKAVLSEMFNRYTINRLKFFIFFKYLSRSDNRICLIPSAHENLLPFLSQGMPASSEYIIPGIIQRKNHITRMICNTLSAIAVYPLFLGITLKIALRGIKRKKHTKVFKFAYDMPDTGIRWHRGYHDFFLYNKGQLHPSKILHVFRGALKDERTRKTYTRYQIPYTNFNNQKSDFRFFVSRILWDFAIKGSVNSLRRSLFTNHESFLLIPSFAVIKMTIEAELFYENNDVKVFISRDDFNPFHIVRTLVARRYGNKTVGFSIGDYSFRNNPVVIFDRYAIWGDFYKSFHEKAWKGSTTVTIGAGIYGNDKVYSLIKNDFIPIQYRELKKKYRIVVIFGTSYSPDSFIAKDNQLQYYSTILRILDKYSDIYCIIRPKHNELDDSDFQKIFKKYKNLTIEKKCWTYRLVPCADLIICFAASSIGMESFTAGKKVLYYDNTGWISHIYARYSQYLVASNEQNMERNIDRILNAGLYLETETIKKIIALHGFKFDGNVVKRFRQCCLDLTKNLE